MASSPVAWKANHTDIKIAKNQNKKHNKPKPRKTSDANPSSQNNCAFWILHIPYPKLSEAGEAAETYGFGTFKNLQTAAYPQKNFEPLLPLQNFCRSGQSFEASALKLPTTHSSQVEAGFKANSTSLELEPGGLRARASKGLRGHARLVQSRATCGKRTVCIWHLHPGERNSIGGFRPFQTSNSGFLFSRFFSTQARYAS